MSNQSTISTTMIILAVVGLVIGGGGGYMISNNSLQPKIADLETNVESLNSEIESLVSTTGALEQEIVENDAEIESLEEDVSYYQSEVSSLTSERSTLQNQIETLQSEVISITNDNSDLQNQISVLESSLDEEEEDYSELESQISSLETSLESLQIQLAVTPGFTKCELYGVSFEYPEGFWLIVDDVSGGYASADLVHVLSTNTDDTEMYDLVWVFTSTTPDLDGGLDSGFEFLQEFDLVLGNRESYMYNGHSMRYQNYTIVDQGVTYNGILGAYYCEESNYFFVVQHTSVSSDVFIGFFQFLNSIRCHNPPIY